MIPVSTSRRKQLTNIRIQCDSRLRAGKYQNNISAVLLALMLLMLVVLNTVFNQARTPVIPTLLKHALCFAEAAAVPASLNSNVHTIAGTPIEVGGEQFWAYVADDVNGISWGDAQATCVAKGLALAPVPSTTAHSTSTLLTSAERFGWVAGRRESFGPNSYGGGNELRSFYWDTGNPSVSRYHNIAFGKAVSAGSNGPYQTSWSGDVTWCVGDYHTQAETFVNYADLLSGTPCARTEASTAKNRNFWCSRSLCTVENDCNGNAASVSGTWPNCVCACAAGWRAPTCLVPATVGAANLIGGYEVFAATGHPFTLRNGVDDLVAACTRHDPTLRPFPIADASVLTKVSELWDSTMQAKTGSTCVIDGYDASGAGNDLSGFQWQFGRSEGSFVDVALPSVLDPQAVSRWNHIVLSIESSQASLTTWFRDSPNICVFCARSPCAIGDCNLGPNVSVNGVRAPAVPQQVYASYYPRCSCSYTSEFEDIVQVKAWAAVTWEEAAASCAALDPGVPFSLATVRSPEQWDFIQGMPNSTYPAWLGIREDSAVAEGVFKTVYGRFAGSDFFARSEGVIAESFGGQWGAGEPILYTDAPLYVRVGSAGTVLEAVKSSPAAGVASFYCARQYCEASRDCNDRSYASGSAYFGSCSGVCVCHEGFSGTDCQTTQYDFSDVIKVGGVNVLDESEYSIYEPRVGFAVSAAYGRKACATLGMTLATFRSAAEINAIQHGIGALSNFVYTSVLMGARGSYYWTVGEGARYSRLANAAVELNRVRVSPRTNGAFPWCSNEPSFHQYGSNIENAATLRTDASVNCGNDYLDGPLPDQPITYKFLCQRHKCNVLDDCNNNAVGVTGSFPDCVCACKANAVGPNCLRQPYASVGQQEVYAITGRLFSYSQAPPLCAAHGATFFAFSTNSATVVQAAFGTFAAIAANLRDASGANDAQCVIDGRAGSGGYVWSTGRYANTAVPNPRPSVGSSFLVMKATGISAGSAPMLYDCMLCTRFKCTVADDCLSGAIAVSGYWPRCVCTFLNQNDEITQHVSGYGDYVDEGVFEGAAPDASVTWAQAADACATVPNRHLAAIRNREQWDFIKTVHNSRRTEQFAAWLGIRQTSTTNGDFAIVGGRWAGASFFDRALNKAVFPFAAPWATGMPAPAFQGVPIYVAVSADAIAGIKSQTSVLGIQSFYCVRHRCNRFDDCNGRGEIVGGLTFFPNCVCSCDAGFTGDACETFTNQMDTVTRFTDWSGQGVTVAEAEGRCAATSAFLASVRNVAQWALPYVPAGVQSSCWLGGRIARGSDKWYWSSGRLKAAFSVERFLQGGTYLPWGDVGYDTSAEITRYLRTLTSPEQVNGLTALTGNDTDRLHCYYTCTAHATRATTRTTAAETRLR